MTGERVERRLAAILAADVAGYSRLMGEDEEGTLTALRAIRRELGDPKIAEHRGRIVKTTGDGLLVEFASVVDAVRCAVEVQREMAARNAAIPAARRIEFRMGINIGDIIIEDGDIFGDGVNVAARLEALSKPGGICLSAAAHEQVRDRLDITFEDLGEQQVKNIARPVRTYGVALGTPSRGTSRAAPALVLPDKPSIAVLPFQNMSGDPEQEYFADGMVEEIITALSRIRWLFVIARNSTFAYKGRAIDVKRVGRELGVRYILEGSVRKSGNRVRITAQLIDAETGTHLWADRFDGSLEDVFDLQDQVARSVAGVIEPVLQVAETRRSVERSISDLTAYDLYLRAIPLALAWDREPTKKALDLLNQAIARDPHYGPALAMAAFCHSQMGCSGWAEYEAERVQGLALARRALECAGNDPNVVIWAAGAMLNFDENPILTKRLVDNALERNPSSWAGWMFSGWIRLFAGDDGDRAIEDFERSLRLDPLATRRAFHLTGIGIAHFFRRRFEEAAATFEASLHELPSYVTTQWFLAACYAQMGRLAEAQGLIARFGTPDPAPIFGRRLEEGLFRNPENRELLLSGWRLAAGEQA